MIAKSLGDSYFLQFLTNYNGHAQHILIDNYFLFQISIFGGGGEMQKVLKNVRAVPLNASTLLRLSARNFNQGVCAHTRISVVGSSNFAVIQLSSCMLLPHPQLHRQGWPSQHDVSHLWILWCNIAGTGGPGTDCGTLVCHSAILERANINSHLAKRNDGGKWYSIATPFFEINGKFMMLKKNNPFPEHAEIWAQGKTCAIVVPPLWLLFIFPTCVWSRFLCHAWDNVSHQWTTLECSNVLGSCSSGLWQHPVKNGGLGY